MGKFTIPIKIVGTKGRTADVEALVDTGATLSVIPAKVLKAIGVKKAEKVSAELADGRRVERSIGEAKLKINGSILTCRVVFGEEKDAVLLGVTVLEELSLSVDPQRKRLMKTDLLMMPIKMQV